MGEVQEGTRENEWFVPRIGPRRFRIFLGLTFYPYTAMNVSFVLIGSLIAPVVHFDRMVGLGVTYILAVGISAHALDASGSNKPWGNLLSETQLRALAASALIPACVIGLYYAIYSAPLLFLVGLAELFFLLAYNLELFQSRFHTDFWFAFSWGFLPVIAGYVVQTNGVTLVSLLGGAFGFLASTVEITASRPYKALKKKSGSEISQLAAHFESILKAVVGVTVATGVLLLVFRLIA